MAAPWNMAKASSNYAAQVGGENGNGASVNAPKTLTSAAGRLDALNDRLAKTRETLSIISSQIGALLPVTAGSTGEIKADVKGAVQRLNDSATTAHEQLDEIENMIGAIGRALG